MQEVDAEHFSKYGLTDRAAEDAATKFSDIINKYDVVYFTKENDTYSKATAYDASATYYYLPVTDNVFAAFNA
jgi:hypothetical protein